MTLKKYKCTVSFYKCAKLPDFCADIDAVDEALAKQGAREFARANGYIGAIQKVTAKEIQE